MVIYFYWGLLASIFSILAVYPVFQMPVPGLGVCFGIFALLFFYKFLSTTASSKEERLIAKAIRVLQLAALTFVLELAGIWVYTEIFSRWRELTWLTPVFQLVFKLLGVPVGQAEGSLYLNGVVDYPLSFLPNAGNLGLLYLIMFGFGLLAPFLLAKNRKRLGLAFGITLGVFLVYLLFRLIVLISFFGTQEVTRNDFWFYLTYFWHPIYAFLSFVPAMFLLHLLVGHEKAELPEKTAIFTKQSMKQHLPAAIGLGLMVFSVILLLFWIPSGSSKSGRVLFEEYYSDWSKSTRPMDETWYSSASTYNYYTFRQYISSFYQVTVNEQPLDQADLSQYDVLILKIPTKPYPIKVMNQIIAYVRNGGGLWVIGDHTNVFGSSAYLNPLLKVFGVQLRYDAVYHNETGKFNPIYPRSLIKHPIIQNVPVFLFMTPCSLEVTNPSMRIVLPGETTKSYKINYGMHNFFPDNKADLNSNFGLHILFAAGDFGRGRVAVFTDSTTLSNFSILLPGKTEMALSTLEWLNHHPAPFLPQAGLLLVILICGFGFAYFYQRIDLVERNMFWPVLVALVFFSAALPTVNGLNRASNEPPKEARPIVKAGFIDQYSSIYLPFAESLDDLSNNYNTFYIWGQREGIFNRYYFKLDQALKDCNTLFMVLPKQRFTDSDLQKLDGFLQQGGQIFVLDDGGAGSSVNDFLNRYGLTLEYHPVGKGKIRAPGAVDFLENSLPVSSVKGEGKILLNWESEAGESLPVLVKKQVGSGELYVFGGVRNFSNQEFGLEDIVPEGNKKQVNDLILYIYKLVRH